MSKKQIKFSYILITIIIVFFSVVFIKISTQSHKIIGTTMSLQRVTINGLLTTNAYLSIPITTTSNKYIYVNALIDINLDNKWETYESANGTQEEWVIKNMAIRITPDVINTFSFQLNDLEAEKNKDLPIKIILTQKSLETWQGEDLTKSVTKVATITQIYSNDIGHLYTPSDIQGSAGVDWNLWRETKDLFAAYIDSSDPDYASFRNNVPDISQRTNECAPTAAANSYIWLAKQYDFSNALKEDAFELIDEFKNDMRWGIFHGVYMHSDYLTGMNNFNQRNNLSVITYPLSEPFEKELYPLLTKAIENSQDVILDLEYKNPQGYRSGGHVITLIGTKEEDDEQFIFIHDPLSPSPQLDVYKIKDNEIIDYRYGKKTYIRYAFSDHFYKKTKESISIKPNIIKYNIRNASRKPVLGNINIKLNNQNLNWKIPKDLANYFIFSQNQGQGNTKVTISLNPEYRRYYYKYLANQTKTIAILLYDEENENIINVNYFKLQESR